MNNSVIIPKPIKINKPWGYELFLISDFKENKNFDNYPLSVYAKILKANTKLSIQVHPNDKLAKELENEAYGKTETWYIIDAEKGSKLYLGIKPETKKEDLIRVLKKQKDPRPYLNTVKVKKGDFFYIPAGLIHAIGGGLTILEPQQRSNTTYRIYDYDRLVDGKKRKLHTDKALKAINFNKDFNDIKNIKQKQKLIEESNTYDKYSLLKTKNFTVEKYDLKEKVSQLNIDTRNYQLIWTNSKITIDNTELKNNEIAFIKNQKLLNIKTDINNTIITIKI